MGRPGELQRGAAGLFVIVIAMVAALIAAVVLTSVQAAIGAGRAQSGADAVALAAAAGRDTASVAAGNHVEVVALVARGNCVEAKVRYRRHVARARAQYDFAWPDQPTCR